jgi:serine phosphatase RsbU (regulator of sigma subunit)/CHASE3 domain sensor protein
MPPVTLRTRLLLLAAGFVVLVLIGGATIIGLTIVRDDRRERESRLVVAQERAIQLAVAYVDQETGQRGFLITADPTFLEPYDRGRVAAARLTAELERLAGPYRRELASVNDSATAWRRGIEPTIAAQRAGQPVDPATIDAGKLRFDALRARITVLQRVLETSTRRATVETQQARSAINVALGTMSVIALGLLVVVAVLVQRWITTPVAGIAGAVRRVRAGALDEPVPEIGPPEIAGLARDVDEMRVRLSEMALDAERARESIEQNARVVLTLRENQRPDIGELPAGWSVAADIRAAEGLVAGDCADVARLDDHTVAVLVVDISGHGAVAGILALRCKELLRSALSLGTGPGEALESTAGQLGSLGDETFLSAIALVIDIRDGTMRYANAGHPPALVCRRDGSTTPLPPTGPIIGPFTSTWATGEAALGPGENLAVYTDGIIEARLDGEMFGPERLAELVGTSDCEDAPAIVERLLDDVEAFTPGRLQDDATIVVICRPVS